MASQEARQAAIKDAPRLVHWEAEARERLKLLHKEVSHLREWIDTYGRDCPAATQIDGILERSRLRVPDASPSSDLPKEDQ